MRKLISTLVSVCITMGMLLATTYAEGWDGRTKTQPEQNENGAYIITTAEELAWFSDNAKTENAVLTVDIDLGDMEWTPIGKSYDEKYSGHFFGNGHTISGLKVTSSAYAGLFGYVSGSVSDLSVMGHITYSGSSTPYAGGITGYNTGTIENCVSDTTIDSKPTSGGIAGTNEGTITKCINKGNITGSSNDIGGIVGQNKGGTITLCANYGSLSSTGSAYVGGICGRIQSGSVIENSYNTGSISGKYTGGIAGYVYSSSDSIKNAYSAGEINCVGRYAGGIVAFMGFGVKTTKITNCYFLKNDNVNTDIYAVQKADNDRDDLCGKTKEELQSSAMNLGDEFENDNEKNPLNNGYPILKWQNSSSAIKLDGEALKEGDTVSAGIHHIDIDYSSNKAENTFAALAIYKEDGTLYEIRYAQDCVLSQELNLQSGYTVKIFLWGNNLKPVGNAVSLKVN